jgi:hypothetical protein
MILAPIRDSPASDVIVPESFPPTPAKPIEIRR